MVGLCGMSEMFRFGESGGSGRGYVWLPWMRNEWKRDYVRTNYAYIGKSRGFRAHHVNASTEDLKHLEGNHRTAKLISDQTNKSIRDFKF